MKAPKPCNAGWAQVIHTEKVFICEYTQLVFMDTLNHRTLEFYKV